jgi:FAD/FMN-containing dehydrogenase
MSDRETINGTTKTLELLAERLAGPLVLPGDPAWDAARSAWDLTVDQRPAAVVMPATTDDVVEVVNAARAAGLRITTQSTGHAAGALPELAGTILLKTTRLSGVEIDTVARSARVGAGAVWLDVTLPASAAGLAPLAGSSPNTGVAGYTLGGGLSWLARRYGLAANSVTAIELVTADGTLRRVDHEHDPELFWALRGGGGSFGVVTALQFRLHAVPDLYAGMLAWPWEQAHRVLRAWGVWIQSLPDNVTSTTRLLQVPPIPAIPEPLRGRNLIAVNAAMLCDERTGAERLRVLRSLRPEIDTFAAVPPVALSHLHMEPEDPIPHLVDGRLLTDFPEPAIDALLGAAGPDSRSPLVSVELRQLGGALARPDPNGGALDRLDAAVSLHGAGIATDPQAAADIDAWLTIVFDAVREWRSKRQYANFTESYKVDTRLFFPDDVYARLVRVKTGVDPDGIFLANHPIRLGVGLETR